MTTRDAKQAEVDANYEVFKKMLADDKFPRFMYGMFALMKDKKVVEFFTTAVDAFKAGSLLYEDEIFSIQEVTTEPIEIYAHAPSDARTRQRAEVDANYVVFERLLANDEIPREKYGMFALMKERQIVRYFPTSRGALRAGELIYGDEPFSVQRVSTEPIFSGYLVTSGAS